jgi:Tfp pilus assembly protein PilF
MISGVGPLAFRVRGAGALVRACSTALFAALLAAGLSACKPAPGAARAAAAPATETYAQTLSEYNAAIRSGEAATKDPIQSAGAGLELIGLYLQRARLTGDYDDYARAEDLLGRVEAKFSKTDAICLTHARLHFTLHRLAKAKAMLDSCPHVAGSKEDVSLRADIAFYSGRYRDAGIIYRALANQVGGPGAYTQLALYSAKVGGPAEASAFMEAAENHDHSDSRVQESWYDLQRGLIELDRGRYAEARAMFTLADQRLPGYWLNEEHFAEATRLNGDTPAARKIYEKVVRETGSPEYMDALAVIDTDAGDAKAAKPLLDRAEAIYETRAKRFPEAIAGHALEHYLKAAPQPRKALALARANYMNRPYGDASIALAKAELLNHRPRAAALLLEGELAKGWDTAEMWWILALASKAAGNAARADEATQEAVRRNPGSAAQYAFTF